MLNIEYRENLDKEFCKMINMEFNKFANNNGVTCNYKEFSFIAKEGDKVVGIIAGHSYYKEVYISDLIVLEQYRNNHIGTLLIKAVEDYYKNKGFDNMNLTTYSFQAPEFYKKCGFEIEFVRHNKHNSKLTKYFLVKYF